MSFSASKDVQEIIKSWLTHLSKIKSYSKNTVDAYLSDLYYFLNFLALHTEQTVTVDMLATLPLRSFRSWLAARAMAEKKTTSNARALSVLRNFYRYLQVNYNIENNAPFLVKMKNRSKSLPKALGIEATFSSLVNVKTMHKQEWLGARDYAILMLLYGCGLRISEALSLTLEDVQTVHSGFLVIKGKGSKERSVPVLAEVLEAVEQYIKQCPYNITSPGEQIFRSKSGKVLTRQLFLHSVVKLRGYAGLPDFTSCHSFRHSFATHLLAKSGDIRSIQELLGHQSASTTQRYTKVENSKLLSVYKNAHPKASG